MFRQLDIEVVDTTHNGLIWHIRLHEQVRQELGITKSRYKVTLDRILATNRLDTYMLDMDFFLMQYLIRKAKSYDFMGLSAVIRSDKLEGSAILTSLLRWQNDQGQRMRQEYTAYEITADGQVTVNPQTFSEWMKQSAQTGDVTIDREQNKSWFEAMEDAADQRLAEVSNLHLHPENNQWVSSAWIEQK